MNLENLQKLHDELWFVPAEYITLGEPQGCHGYIAGTPDARPASLAQWAESIIALEELPEGDIAPPSLASWLGLCYEEVMNLFFMQPADAPQCNNKVSLKQAALNKMRVFDSYPAEVRKNVLLTLLERTIATGRIDWTAAKAEHDVEVAA